MTKTEQFDNAADFLSALHGSARASGVPRQRSAERTGLATLIKAGWNVEWDSAMRLRLYRGEKTTAWHADEKAACDEAKALE